MLNSPVDEIKNRLDIVDVIGSYIRLQKAGANFRAVCPFHSEKKPSFFVSPARQIWHCFGCSAGGDIFKFVMQIEGVEFGDALRILAQKAGVELRRQDPKLKSQRQRLYEICELACRFFERQLGTSKAGQEAKNYLLGRGITGDSIKKWRLGYAPDSKGGLSDFLVGRGYLREEIRNAGLSVKTERNVDKERFWARIIFPIFDSNSQAIGFGGRVFERSGDKKAKEEIAKYINSPSTFLYDKSRVLYGLNKAKVSIRKKDACALVEGYTDVIMAHQAGFDNVVASSGTALTPFQLRILKRYSDNLLTAFDMDVAGDSATKRGIDLALEQGFNIRIIAMPRDSDPCDVISKNKKEWEELVKNAKSILDFYFENTLFHSDPKTPEGRRKISKILLPVIKRIPDKIEQSLWIQSLAKALGVREENVLEELQKAKIETGYEFQKEETIPEPLKKSRKELLEERLITLILKSPENLNLIGEKDLDFMFPLSRQTLCYFKEKGVCQNNFPTEFADFITPLSLRAEIENFEAIDFNCEFKDCLTEIRTVALRNKLGEISKKIKKAEEEKDSPKVQKLLEEFNVLAKEANP